MPPFGPISRRDLIYYLRQAGYFGPMPGGKHPIMKRGDVTITVPNLHRGDISHNLLSRILRQAGISREEWERL